MMEVKCRPNDNSIRRTRVFHLERGRFAGEWVQPVGGIAGGGDDIGNRRGRDPQEGILVS